MRKSLLLITLTAPLGVTLVAQPPRGPQPRPILIALDLDKDGTLSAAELAAAPKSLLTLDINGDGQLTQDEFFPRPQGLGASADEQVTRLMAFDKNGDGFLTADELPERMQALLTRGDTNKDGKLSPDEIRAMSGRQGMPNGRAIARGGASGMLRMDALVNALDADHDGILSADEIKNSTKSLLTLDKNGDGQLTPDEFKVREQTPKERVDHMLDEWDTNKDGKIAKEEAPERMQQMFESIDTNKDGFLTPEELTVYFANMPAQQQRGPRPNSEEKK